MRLSDKLLEKYQGKYAVRHAGLLVIPQRGANRKPFDTADEAKHWAQRNYRGADWEVVHLDPRHPQ